MDFSDDQDNQIEEEVDAFRNIIPPKSKKNRGGHGKIELCASSTFIKDQCAKLMEDILSHRIQDTVQIICNTIVQNRTFKKSIVIVLNIKRNQKKDLLKFVEKFQNYEFEQRQSLKTIDVIQLGKEDVRDIALDIQIHEDGIQQTLLNQGKIQKGQKRKKADLVLYINRKVTNLSQSNIHVFDGSVIKANYGAIIPTYQNLKIVDGLGIVEENEMFYFEAYNNKELFIEFFYRCLVSKSIMAYLPKQILGIIKLYDYYPLSYQQGCNMLIYACQTFDAKCEKNKIKKIFVDMKELIRVFNRTWKMIWNDQIQVARYNFYQLSHVILDQKANYKVPEFKILNFIRMNQVNDSGIDDLNENNFYKKFIKRFRERLQADQDLKNVAKFFDDFEDRKAKYEIKKMKKNARQIGLGFQSKNMKSEKQLFEDKITFLFKQATAQVRRQAKYVEWKELKVFEMFQPQIVKDTADGILQDPEFRDVFNTIRSSANCPMGRLIEKFKSMQIGKLIYIIRCLELKGLVQLTKHTLRPSLVTNFYDKAQFRMTGNE